MFHPKKVKIGIAPIASSGADMPEMGAENSFLQTISEIALTGYVGTEIGCQFPRDPAILNKGTHVAVFPPSPAGSAPT